MVASKGARPKAKGRAPNSVTVYVNRKRRIKAIVTGLTRKSANNKTGDMLQTTITPLDVSPLESIASGDNTRVCGGCAFKPTADKPGQCYVIVGQMPNEVWKTTEGESATMPDMPDKSIRLGSWGDPGFLPLSLLKRLTAGRKWTGYTHQWRTIDRRYSQYLMASVEDSPDSEGTIEEQIELCTSMGYRYYRVAKTVDDVRPNEVACPFYSTDGRVQCADCRLCSGASIGAKSVVVPVHGAGASSYIKIEGS